jgi:ATP-dependent helicase/DNAse subunit B
VIVYLGPARSGKTEELLRRYGEALGSSPNPFGTLLWLAPTARAAVGVREELMASGIKSCFNPGIMVFDDFARRVLRECPARLRHIDATMQRELLRRLIQAALGRGELDFYAASAGRAGFAELVLDHIRELKRRDILPHAFAQARVPDRDSRQQQELAQLYADYQQQLTTHSLVDAESSYWAARDALKTGTCRAFQNLELVVVDGFTDFTHTQHEILALLAKRTRQLVISLQSDSSLPHAKGEGICRADLFAKTSATLASLRRHHPRLDERQFAPSRSNWPAQDFLLQHLFSPPGSAPPCSADAIESLDRYEIVAAASAQDEVVQIARRIKKLLKETGARPSEILVVLRSLRESAARIREVFDEFGIPYYLEDGEGVATTATCKTLQALLRLDREDWPFRAVVSIITNRALTALDEGARRAADWLIRDLQVAQGRRELFERIEQLAGNAPIASELSEHAQRRVQHAKQALPALEKLAAALDALPQEGTALEWSSALARLAARLGLSPSDDSVKAFRTGHFSDQSASPSLSASNQSTSPDELAWQRIDEHFASLQRLDSWLNQPPRTYSRHDVAIVLADIARHQTLPRQFDDAGRVRVLAAAGARTVGARHLFLPGMSEQAFPAPERAGRLCIEADYRFISRAIEQQGGGRKSPQLSATRPQEEMLLFYGVLACAQESLTISYPALDDKAQELPPSPYVTEIRRTFGAKAESRLRFTKPQLSPVPSGEACGSADWRVSAVARALVGNLPLLAGLFGDDARSPMGSAIEAGLRIVHERSRRESFGPAEGLLASPSAAARFGERFGRRHLWSPSQWETYAGCPYRFFLEHVLGLEPLGDLELETDYQRRGSRLHDVLAEFHRQWKAQAAERTVSAEQEAARFIEHLRNVVEMRLASPRAGIDAALAELDRRQILKWSERHFDHHTRYEALWSQLDARLEPAHFELRFGPSRSGETDADDPHSRDDAFTLSIGGEPVRVTGRIDRIDVARVGERIVFNVIDYKSGRKASLKEEHIATGEHLQLPIYVAAAQALLFDGNAQPLAAGYWTMAGGFDAKGVLAVQHEDTDGRQHWNKMRTTVETLIGGFIDAIRRGQFPVFSRDDQCTSRCDFNTICRITQIRSLGKAPAACGLAETTPKPTPPGNPLARG